MHTIQTDADAEMFSNTLDQGLNCEGLLRSIERGAFFYPVWPVRYIEGGMVGIPFDYAYLSLLQAHNPRGRRVKVIRVQGTSNQNMLERILSFAMQLTEPEIQDLISLMQKNESESVLLPISDHTGFITYNVASDTFLDILVSALYADEAPAPTQTVYYI